MNLQFGMVAAQADDAFLMASDGLWDTLDPVQVRLLRPCPSSHSFHQGMTVLRPASATVALMIRKQCRRAG